MDLERWRSRFNRRQVSGRGRLLGIVKDADAVTCGAICFSSSSHFKAIAYSKRAKPVMLPPGREQAFNHAKADRIGDLGKHHRDRPGFPMQCYSRGWGSAQDHVRLQGREFGRVGAHPFNAPPTPAIVDANIAPFRPAKLLQSLAEGP